jgi:outer membrane immunogenic protein
MAMRIAWIAAAAALCLGASIASAQDTTAKFEGFRVEGNVGWDQFRSEGARRNKLGYGATIGFDGSINDKIIIGPEASYWRANGWSQNCTPGVIGGSVCHKSFEEWGAAVRAGYRITPNVMVFGKGGYVSNEQRKRFDAPIGETSYYNHGRTDGYQVGGGAELSMRDRMSGVLSGLYVNAQYVYANYNDHTSRQRVMAGIGLHFK